LKKLREIIFRKKVKIAENDLEKKGFFEKLTKKFNIKINQISNTETATEFKTIFNLIKDWYSGNYKDVDKSTIASLLGAII
jgi:coproporphyrinogen III oxidase-like Fe-S oxidoreductase